MTDAYLVSPWYHLVIVMKVDQAEVVPGIEPETLSACLFGSPDKRGDGSLAVDEIIGGVRFGIKLHSFCSTFLGVCHHLLIGIDEDGCAYASLVETSYHIGEE